MTSSRTRFYRDKVHAKFAGVCAGIADYTGVDVLWVRLGFVVGTCCGLEFLPVIYIALAFLTERKPAALYADAAEQKFWQGVRQSPRRTAREVKARLRDIDRRLGEVEAFYVSGNAGLAAEIERLR